MLFLEDSCFIHRSQSISQLINSEISVNRISGRMVRRSFLVRFCRTHPEVIAVAPFVGLQELLLRTFARQRESHAVDLKQIQKTIIILEAVI